jgi:hypothetical protein
MGLPYELIRTDPAFADTAAFREKYGFPAEPSGNRDGDRPMAALCYMTLHAGSARCWPSAGCPFREIPPNTTCCLLRTTAGVTILATALAPCSYRR